VKTSRLKQDVRRRSAFALAFAALCALAVVAGSASQSGAASAKTLGNTKNTPNPSCPRNCLATGSVTAFQREANGKSNPFRVKEAGKLVAWAIDLSRPNKEQREFFGKFFEHPSFGKAPTAGISVIKRTGGRKYKLKRHSEIVTLGSELGQKQTFTLASPLAIDKGDIVALTLPTWAPNFRGGLNREKNAFRASRSSKKCSGNKNIKNGSPHRQVGSERVYGCDYQGSRLLYWAYYRPD
jgi:hypothetical protein